MPERGDIIQKRTLECGTEVIVYHADLPDTVDFGTEVAIDTETLGLNHARDRLCLVQMYSEQGKGKKVHCIKVPIDSDSAPNLQSILADPKILKIFHCMSFDITRLFKTYKTSINNVFCTRAASKIARTNSDNHSLKGLCAYFLGIKISKEESSSDWGAPTLSNEQLHYAAQDVLYLPRIMNKLCDILSREKRDGLVQWLMKIASDYFEYTAQGWDVHQLLHH